jgi:hypothetical protein
MAQDEIYKQLNIQNFDPVVFLLMTAADPGNPIDLRVAAAAKATPYVHSTLKAIEVTGEDGGPLSIDLQDSKARLASMLKVVQGLVEDEASPYPDAQELEVLVHLP